MIILFGFDQDVFGSGQKIIENTILKNTNTSPDFQLDFQRPSYILESDDTKKIVYYCNNSNEECKINFNFTKDTGKNLSSTLNCEIKTDFESNQFSRCNPNTVIFPKGIHSLSIRVSSKKNIEDFSERKIIIINGEFDEEVLRVEKEKIKQWLALSGFQPSPPKGENTIDPIPKPVYSGEVKIISGEAKMGQFEEEDIEEITTEQDSSIPLLNSPLLAKSGEATLVPNFSYIFQRPSYVLPESIDNQYLCDKSKGECKINFKLIDEEEKDISSKFECEIGLDFISSEYQKCNPNTIIFPEGNNKVVFRVYEKNNRDNFREKIILVNNESSPQPSPQGEGEAQKTTISSSPSGEDTDENLTEKHYLPQTKIQVQGKIGKTKKVGISRMTCYTYSECSINFTSGKLYKSQREGINFRWDFGNGQKYRDYNPKSVKFAPGNYKVKLIVSDNFGNKKTEIYRVKVINLYTKTEIKNINKTIESITDFSLEDELLKNLKIYSPNTNKALTQYIESFEGIDFSSQLVFFSNIEKNTNPPSGTSPLQEEQSKQQKALAKNISLRVTFQKKNLKVYGTSEPLSEISLKIGEQEFKQQTDSEGNYTFKINTLSSGIYKIQATVINSKGKIVAQKTSAEKEFTKEYLTQLESYKMSIEEKSLANNSTNTKINKALAKNISLRVSLQKKNLKLYGTTQANSKIIFTIGNQTFTTLSNNEGKYKLKTNSIQVGKYKIRASVYNSGNLVAEKSSSTKTFSSEYIQNMRSYLTKNSSNNSSNSYRTKKFTLENFIPQTPDFVTGSLFNIKVFVINMLIAILSLILLFIVMIKRKLI
ncbi:PKD domain-containing protein [Candidatus Gracilibacteria bacterium]|nr:PKD domain-containing protein [Candidatus Gracilibacteria bacterium]